MSLSRRRRSLSRNRTVTCVASKRKGRRRVRSASPPSALELAAFEAQQISPKKTPVAIKNRTRRPKNRHFEHHVFLTSLLEDTLRCRVRHQRTKCDPGRRSHRMFVRVGVSIGEFIHSNPFTHSHILSSIRSNSTTHSNIIHSSSFIHSKTFTHDMHSLSMRRAHPTTQLIACLRTASTLHMF